ncbi:unnamed protein product [Pedinophyceae sp. YPF-701]|nr:unnamed protein product [Pedinophyceae sp. YPF-701]
MVHYVVTHARAFPRGCRPLLLAGFLGISASAAARALSHSLTFAVNLAVTTNLAQHLYHKSKATRAHIAPAWKRQLPSLLALASIPLVMADPTRHVLQDAGLISAAMYRADCGPDNGLHGLLCLSLAGWIITVFCTYAGFGLLISGVLEGAGVPAKVRAAWAASRARREAGEESRDTPWSDIAGGSVA